ncbi:hypothetical protein H2200_011992 [Cladophialophora chaetospira]|uniref:Proteophosphoglycan 5 n=1 Tax=Cladophialophora chaetospira TaxID=386627 RepID=A0AA38WZ33_9EURO|nr:hypothetical protein H2200_011992 [Cladophialophora chaetospira]
MSAPIATPHAQSQKAPRRSGRKPTQAGAIQLDGSTAPLLPSADESERNPSPAAGHRATKNNSKGQQRRPSHATNKVPLEAKHVSNFQDRGKATPTPMKSAAYAGSTFQQSPAASALPLPSFYSKSLPNASAIPTRPPMPETTSTNASTTTPSDESPSKPEVNPCDFLFQAARQARTTPRSDSPATRAGNLSVPNGSPASRSPAPREGDAMFPFELDGGNHGGPGAAFATPYKERIEALRSTSSGGKSMDDTERKAKTEALKKLLMKSSAQHNDKDTSPSLDLNNPFSARAPTSNIPGPQQGHTDPRATSNPSTPSHMLGNSVQYTSHQFNPVGYPFPTPQTETPKRPNSSRLRHVYGAQSEPEYAELSSDSAVTPPSSSRKHANYHPQPPQYNAAPYTSHPQKPTHRAKPSAQQLEDDLRRVLKLDLVSRG